MSVSPKIIRQTESELLGIYDALNRVQAIIEFELDGTIIQANENFLEALGYSLEEIQGQHHRMFCDSEFVNSIEYKQLWNTLRAGNFFAGEFKRFTKDGREIWINASYNPIFDGDGNPVKVVKFATDVTEAKVKNSDNENQLKAMDRSQAVIEFTPDGTILGANANFLAVTGYSLDEIQGKHHQIFCEPEYASSVEYKQFWQKLSSGVFDSGEYKRIGKGGKEVWISFLPITFELTVLFAAHSTVLAFLVYNKLFPGKSPVIMHPEQTCNKFVVAMDKDKVNFEDAKALFGEHGALEVKIQNVDMNP